MSGDELVRCRCCGDMFFVTRPARGPLAGYCSPRCRQGAYRDRRHAERAAEVAELALASTQGRLSAALVTLSPSSVTKLLDRLREGAQANLSLVRGDGLCRSTTTGPSGVVAPLHTEEG